RRLGGSAEPDPGLAGLAGLPPGLKVVRAGDPVEAGLLARDGLLEQLARVVLLVHAAEEVTGHLPALPHLHRRKTAGSLKIFRKRPIPRSSDASSHAYPARSGDRSRGLSGCADRARRRPSGRRGTAGDAPPSPCL